MKKINILDQITAEDAFVILKIIVKEDKQIEKKIEQIAKKYLSEIDLDSIAEEVYSDLNFLDVEELWDSSGSTRFGYIDPSERAWEMFEEALESFIDEFKKYRKLSMYKEAKIYCMGILKGIYRYEKESTSEFKEWAVDAPCEYFRNIKDEWEKEQNNTKDITEMNDFIKINFPEWS